MRSWLQTYQGTLGGRCPSLSPPLLSFIPPSSIILAWHLVSVLKFLFISILFFFLDISSFDFIHLLSFALNCRSFSLAIGRTPSLFISLPVYRWVRVSLFCIRPSVRPSVRPSIRPCMRLSVCVCPSGGGWGWGPTACEEGLGTLTSCAADDPESVPV